MITLIIVDYIWMMKLSLFNENRGKVFKIYEYIEGHDLPDGIEIFYDDSDDIDQRLDIGIELR